jgi:DNA-directed RNA polymerase specialized sigma24 family protein
VTTATAEPEQDTALDPETAAPAISDEKLCASLRGGRDDAALTELVGRYESLIIDYCRAILGPPALARAVAVEAFRVFARRYRNLRRWALPPVGKLLYTASTLCRRRAGEIPQSTLQQEILTDLPNEDPPDLPTRLQAVDALLAFRSLNRVYREIVFLKYRANAPVGDIARITGLSVAQVCDRLAEAHHLFARRLAQAGQ